jgi:hypothetical protein
MAEAGAGATADGGGDKLARLLGKVEEKEATRTTFVSMGVETAGIDAELRALREEIAQLGDGAEGGAGAAAAPGLDIELPPYFFGVRGAFCRAIPTPSRRSFGAFTEKTLKCNQLARDAIDRMCNMGGFTQSWAAHAAGAETFTMTKIPVVILVKLMLGLPEGEEAAVQSLRGAYSICMDTARRAPWSIWEERAPRFDPIVNPACLPAAAWQPLPHGGLPPLPPVLDSSSRPYRLGPRGGRAPLLPQPVEGGGAGPAPSTRRGDGVSRR